MSTSPLLLIDGDEVVWRIASVFERETQWDEQNWVLYSNADAVFNEVCAHMDRLFERFDTRRHVLAFTGSNNFRKTLDATYKASRAGNRKPLCYGEVRERCGVTFHTMVRPQLEADDILGILATKPGQDNPIICGQDKDFKTVPCQVWDGKDLWDYSEEADYWHMFQTLVGDTTDGYKGCPGVGPVKAEKILRSDSGASTLWGRVVDAYEAIGLSKEVALTQARLARILRWSEWDQENQEVILWTPSS